MHHDNRTLIILLTLLLLSTEVVYGASITATYSSDYSGLKVGEEYRLHVELVDTATGQLARNGGTALAKDVKFKAKSESANLKASLSIDTKSNAGKTLAMKAKLCKGGKTIAVLSDGSASRYRISVPAAPNPKPKKETVKKPTKKAETKKTTKKKKTVKKPAKDKKQPEKKRSAEVTEEPVMEPELPTPPVKKPDIKSEVIDGATGTHECKARTNSVIVDVLRISGLLPGQKYEVTTRLVSPSSGKLVVKGAVKTDAFTAEKTAHELKHKVVIDATGLAGKSCLAVSEVKVDGAVIAETGSLSREKRRVKFVEEVIENPMTAVKYRANREMLILADTFVDLFANNSAS